MIRRLKKDVLSELPEKRRQKIQVATDDKLLVQIKKMMNKMFDEVSDGKQSKFNGEESVQTLITNYSTNFSDYLSK
jgi:hypothetical protein